MTQTEGVPKETWQLKAVWDLGLNPRIENGH